jgi:NAD(P)-dependent dehydrogenase (short-subunit alcohol dehydrogenase family)/acyl carrier protein
VKPLDVLLAIVSERTGYPRDMLDPDLDLEADLGIDSIKRIEILGTLGQKLGFEPRGNGKRSEMVEELAQVKTLRAIAGWVEAKAGAGASASPAPAPTPADPPPSPSPEEAPPPLHRYVLAVEPIEPAVPNGFALAERRFALTDDGRGVAPRLAELLAARGAAVRILDGLADGSREPLGAVDGLIHLAPLAPEPSGDPEKTLFSVAKEAVASGAQWLFAATGLGGAFGHLAGSASTSAAGVAGFLKSVAKEWPDLRVRAIDLDVDQAAERMAEMVMAEILCDGREVEVGYRDGVRLGLRPIAEARPENGAHEPLSLGPESVVLITGGARGITAAAALELAARYGCALELVGRTPAPEGAEDPRTASAADAPALRRTLAQLGRTQPAVIEAEVGRLLAARELRATLGALAARLGDRLRYHQVDVRDQAAFGALLDDVYRRHGRLDGVIHAAGVIEDRLLRDKSSASFERVFDTKVQSALTLVEKLRPDVRFVVFFSSIAGAFGNRGQSDYAAANDYLDKLAHQLQRRLSGRVLSINWGPWAGGMMSPELERESARRGIGLIGLEEGVAHLLDEVRHGSASQVILLRIRPERLGDLIDPPRSDEE